MEFLKQVSGKSESADLSDYAPISIDGTFVFADIDGPEDDSESIQIAKDQFDSLSKSQGGNIAIEEKDDGTIVARPDDGGKATSTNFQPDDEAAWLQVDFKNQDSIEWVTTARSGGTGNAIATKDISNPEVMVQGEKEPDTDGDGILDKDDLDDDNDGILDTDEGYMDQADLKPSGLDGPLHKIADGGFKVDIEVVDQDRDGARADDEDDKHILKAIEFGGNRYEDFILPDTYTSGFDTSDGVFLSDNGDRTSVTNDDKDWEQQILEKGFQTADLGEYQSVDGGVDSSDSYTLHYDTPVVATGHAFVAITERDSNNDQVIEALDENGHVIGKLLVDASNGDYFDTGHDVHYSGGQNAGISVHALDSLVPVGTQVHALKISFNDARGDGPDGKVFLFGDLEKAHAEQDTDGDGIADHLDLDSDNDGISDLRESGLDASRFDTDNDGVIDAAVAEDGNQNGISEYIEKAAGAEGKGTTPVDSDKDGIADFRDLDSDGDTIGDFIEGQPTKPYQPGDGDLRNDDSDGDGIVDLFDKDSEFGGTFNTPVDTDDDKVADYLDTDSDNDG
ncbi:MAG: hypothetical protein AAF386_10740, partial [Pseudomonadota bacterium]